MKDEKEQGKKDDPSLRDIPVENIDFYRNSEKPQQEQAEEEEFLPGQPPEPEDISSRSGNWFTRFYATKRKTKITLTVVLALLLAVVLVVVIYAGSKLAKIKVDTGEDYSTPNEELFPDAAINPMDAVENAASLKELLKTWATNGGQKMSSKNVINVLLLGLDTRSGTDGALASHADTIMIASLNKKTKTITIASVFRDCYTYTKADKERYCKMTEAYFWGGPQVLIETLENNYKIKIDDYVSVNFSTFPKVIDALDGIDIEITPAEAAWMTAGKWSEKPMPVGSGMQHVNGEQALAFSRIRHLDSDIERARRQRAVIGALIERSKNASLGQLDQVLDVVLPNVRTSYARSSIVSLASQAFMYNWMSYEIKQVESPAEENRWGGMIGDTWFWVNDYPASAREIQLAFYGESNINLTPGRITAIDLSPGGKKSGTTGSNSTTGSSSAKETTTERKGGATSPSKGTTASSEPKKEETTEQESTTKEETTGSGSGHTTLEETKPAVGLEE